MSKTDPIKLTADLIKCPSVTPADGGALKLIERVISPIGFNCTKIVRNDISNLFARWGSEKNGPTFCFNGHIDVVPPGDLNSWSFSPFSGNIKDGCIYGRGACDMKSAIAAFISASTNYLESYKPDGSIVLAITGDEEGKAKDGTLAIIDWMKDNQEHIDHCLIGEPTSRIRLGDTLKIGRRGSLTVNFTVVGIQGHVAYIDRANNPLTALTNLLVELTKKPLDLGTNEFDPSSLVITTIDTGNPAANIIPKIGKATINIRFNKLHSPESLLKWLEREISLIENKYSVGITITSNISALPFLSPPGEFSHLVATTISNELGFNPETSTSGGTSDARFMQNLCPVIEFGLVGSSMHKINENVQTSQIIELTRLYQRLLENYFKTFSGRA